jgi:2-C-methyl-D-erythritol 2,4-cyclodiphosphate synthase
MIRVGQGFDVHKFSAGRPCIIGGVTIDHPLGLDGHSDADVLLHSISDAILGAAGLGDIGNHFPDNDLKFKDMSSRDIPKISPHTKEMIENIAEDCLCGLTQINIKATTTEGLGFIGRAEGIAAQAICTIQSFES